MNITELSENEIQSVDGADGGKSRVFGGIFGSAVAIGLGVTYICFPPAAIPTLMGLGLSAAAGILSRDMFVPADQMISINAVKAIPVAIIGALAAKKD